MRVKMMLPVLAVLCAACARERLSPETVQQRKQEIISEVKQSREREAWLLYMKLVGDTRVDYHPDALFILARSMLVQGLADDDPSVRRKVLDVLDYADDAFAASEAIKHLGDTDISVQRAAVDLIRRLGNPAARPLLYPLLRKTDGVVETERLKMHTVYAIARLHDKTLPIAPAVMGISSPASNVRAAAATALGELGNRDAIPALRRALFRDEVWEVNTVAVVALLKLGERATVEDFALRAAESDQPEKIGWAIEMREAYEVGPTVNWIIQRGTFHPSPVVRACAAAALGSMRVGVAKQRLKEMMESQLEMIAVSSVAYALALLDEPGNVHWIARAAELEPAELRVTAIRYMARLDADRHARLFTQRLDDPDAGVRMAAVEALRKVPPEKALPGLGYALGDEADSVRFAVAAIACKMIAAESE